MLLGFYGTIDDPEEGVDHMIQGMMNSPDVDVAVPEKKFRPSGGGDALTCGVGVKSVAGQKVTLPYCAWANSGTSASVAETDSVDLAKDPKPVDLQAFADKVSKIRSEAQASMG
ncbi:hypothetical protein [Streptomyces sp. BP-8]|uniref:DUF3558 domain-containing protein n=1 Tax=Streptomyces sirii TaxID=3127701 RepID=A0ABZ2QNN3_9ACTN